MLKHALMIGLAILFISSSLSIAAVTLTDLGSQVKLDNGIVEATFEKNTATMITLKLNGVDIMSASAGGVGYMSIGINGVVTDMGSGCTYSLIQDTPTVKEVSFKRAADATWPMDIEQRFALVDGESGIYCYQIYEHDPSMADADLSQSRMTFRITPDLFTRVYIDDDRIYDEPTPAQFAAGTDLVPAEAQLLGDGSIYYKYLRSNYLKYGDVYGWAGSGYGAWVVRPSLEHHNGGPTKQHICAHQTSTTPVMMSHTISGHYGSGSAPVTAADGSWTKIGGPVFLYLNENPDMDSAWADAKAQYITEKGKWPYSWMVHSEYPLAAGRGTVTGTLNITDGSSADGAFVILAQPTDGTNDTNWQRQGKDYIFWTQAAADGTFTIDKVRPGTYTLYANVPGVLDEYAQNGVTVTAGATNALGQLDWAPRKYGNTIWQIGIANRSAEEYLHGDDFRKFGLWFDYQTDFPSGINYTIGTSNYATDWNFNQWCKDNGDGTYSQSPWTINFDMDDIPGEKAVLTVAIAAARNPNLMVEVNGVQLLSDSLINDSAAPRSGIQGFYRERIIEFDSSILSTTNTNTVVLTQTTAGLFQSIMYDCIRLEVGSKADVNKDGVVDLKDVAGVSRDWLKCTNPQNPGCINLN